MFEWEEKWFSSDLPPPPARILLGGAGSGREIRHLARHEYRIVAFDPVHSFVRHGRSRLQSDQCEAFLTGSFEDLAIHDGSDPDEWLLVVVTRRGNERVVYRRLYLDKTE